MPDLEKSSVRAGCYVFQHPHDVYVDSGNALYVVQWWSGCTYPIKRDLLGA